MNNFLNKLFYLFISLSFFSLNGQDHVFDAQLLKTEDGLANLLTTSVTKDKNGYLWIGTNYGLNRYDGYQFTLYTSEKNGLYRNDKIYKIHEDEAGNLWLFYFKQMVPIPSKEDEIIAIDIFNPKTGKVIPFEAFFGDSAPFKLSDLRHTKSIDTQKRLWLTTKSGKIYLFQEGEFIKVYEQKDIFFQFITVTKKEEIWLGFDKQLLRINLNGELLEKHELSNEVVGIWAGKQQGLWIATGHWILKNKERYKFKYDLWSKTTNGDLTPFLLTKGEKVFETKVELGLFIHRTHNGFWHLKKEKQLQVFDENGVFEYNFNEPLKEEGFINFTNYCESANYLWLSTPTGLLKTMITENPFQLVHKKTDYSDCRGITEDEEGNIYFFNDSMYKWHPKQEIAPVKLPVVGSFALTDIDSFLWGGTYSNVHLGRQINLITKETFLYEEEEANFAYTTLKTATPQQLLIGTNNGLRYVDIQQKKSFPFTKYNEFDELKNSEIYHLYQNTKGIWGATNKGIFLMNEQDGVLRMYTTTSKDLPFDYVRHIYAAKNGVFWLATKGGGIIQWKPSFTKGKPSKYKQLTKKEGLSNDYIYAIYGDNYGKLWMPSDMGLMCMDEATYEVNVFLKEHGLPHNEFNLTAHYQAKDSTLYFGGLGGLISFHPKILGDKLTNNVPLRFVGYHVLEEGKENTTDKTSLLATTNTLIIKPTDKFFELEFTLLDFDDQRQHKYAYQIEGYSDRWNYIDENYIRIPSLPYGDYRLKVRGRNYSKGWSKQEIFLDVKVLKPFYLESWFIIATIFSTLCLMIAGVKWRLKSLREDRVRLELEVQKRTKTIQGQAEELKMLDKAKTQFFSNITHEFRTPLTLIIGPLEQVMEMDLPTKGKIKLNRTLKNARHLLCLINQLLDLSKLESGQMKVERMHGDIIAYTKELASLIKPLAEKKQQSFRFITQQEIWKTQFDRKKWDKIVYNLLSNAIKYTPVGGKIQMELTTTNLNNSMALHLVVKDSGIGIKATQLVQIFNRFYQVDNSSTRHQEGTGIGLALVKELIEIQGGTIIAASKIGEGTTFEAKIPIAEQPKRMIKQNLLPTKTEGITDLVAAETIDTAIFEKNNEEQKEKLKILIIEDNTDLRLYIRDCIDATKYLIEEAANGIEGIEKTMNIIPDLIISDVMMPGKNGFEVTSIIRSTTATSHIPIILLTAKAALESRIQGLKSGADVYLTKPFSPKELDVRIQKLIEIRQLIRQNVEQPKLNLTDPIYEKENDFIKEAHSIITNNINSTTLNGEFIGRKLGMSRMQVHRKMKALVNQSASEMIKELRLQKGHKLLLTQNYNISETAYQTGFNSPTYFSKSFKDRFGYSPSEILKKTTA